MRDQSHIEQVERWATFIRENPTKWKKFHTEFINALFQKNEEMVQRLLQQPDGRQKLKELYNIKNVDGCDWLK